jgi:hypothetical protein
LEVEDFESLALDKESLRKAYFVVEVGNWNLEEEDIVEQDIKAAFDKEYLMRPLWKMNIAVDDTDQSFVINVEAHR